MARLTKLVGSAVEAGTSHLLLRVVPVKYTLHDNSYICHPQGPQAIGPIIESMHFWGVTGRQAMARMTKLIWHVSGECTLRLLECITGVMSQGTTFCRPFASTGTQGDTVTGFWRPRNERKNREADVAAVKAG
jgi:hypothetical protein